jgi:hypothetical protein
MSKKNLFIAGLVCLIALVSNFQLALAHEEITIGDYTLEIGWVNEPPIVGQQNAIVVNVSTTSDGKPVEDVSGLTVAVSYGGQNKTLTLQPLGEDTPGQFVAPILPTIPGQYTVNLGGKLGETDVKADVQPEEVQSSDTLAFPSTGSEEESAGPGINGWVSWLALIAGVVGIVLGVMALRRVR